MPSIAPSIDPVTSSPSDACSIPTMEPSGPSPALSFSTSVDCGGITVLNHSNNIAVCYFSSCGVIQFRFQSYLNDIFYFSQSKLTLYVSSGGKGLDKKIYSRGTEFFEFITTNKKRHLSGLHSCRTLSNYLLRR
jgi:hypothetical protein